MLRAATLCIATLAVTAVAAAQGPPAPAHVRFRAIGPDGAPVADLKVSDVSVKIDGRPRRVTSLVLRQADQSAGPVTSPLPPPYGSNTSGPASRTIVVLLDEDSIAAGSEAPIKAALHRFLTELPAGDLLGVLSAQSRINLAPTTDRTAAHKAVDRISGQGHTDETDVDAACRTVNLLKAVGGIVAIPTDSPTVLMVFSGGVTAPSAEAFRIGTPSGTCQVRLDDFQNLARAAALTSLAVYVMHLTEGLVAQSAAQSAGLESLAGALGGDLIRVSTDAQPALERVQRETAAFYDAQFDTEGDDRNGQPHRLELRGSRDRVRVQAQTAIALTKRRAPRSPQDLLRTQTEYRELPLHLTGYAARNPGDENVRVVALFEGLDGPKLTAASVALFDDKDTLKRQWTAQAGDLARRPVMAALTAPRGAYRMRVAAIDDTGRVGTADYEIQADVTRADPLRLSNIVLGVQSNGGFAPRLEFSSEPAAIGLLEIYGVPKGGTVTVSLDIAPSDTEAALATADTSVSRTKADDMFVAYGGFDIRRMAPGDYLMRAVVSLDGKPVGRVTRTLRKVRPL